MSIFYEIEFAKYILPYLQSVAERLALLLAAGGHLRDEQRRADGILVLRISADEAAVALLVAKEEIVLRVLLISS